SDPVRVGFKKGPHGGPHARIPEVANMLGHTRKGGLMVGLRGKKVTDPVRHANKLVMLGRHRTHHPATAADCGLLRTTAAARPTLAPPCAPVRPSPCIPGNWSPSRSCRLSPRWPRIRGSETSCRPRQAQCDP